MEGRERGGAGRTASLAFATAAAVLVLLAGALRFWGLDHGLPHPLSRPDEIEIARLTASPARGEFRLDWSVYPDAFIYLCWAWSEAVLWGAQASDLVPEGDYASVLRRDPATLLLIQRSLSATVATLTVLLLVLVARRPLGRPGALVAGLLLATNLLHVRDSHSSKTEALLTLGGVLVLAAAVPLARRASARRAMVSGLALGAALAVKYTAATLAAPIYAAAVRGSPRRRWRRWVPPQAFVAAGAAFLVFAATSPFLLTSPAFLDMLGWMLSQLVGSDWAPSVGPGEATWVGFDPGGELYPFGEVGWASGWIYHAAFSLPYGAGLLPTLLAPAAVVWGLRHKQPLLFLAALFCLVHFTVVGTSRTLFLSRYMTPLVPALALVEAGILVAAASRLPARGRSLGLALAALLLAAEPLAASVAHDRIAAREDTRVLASRWMGRSLPAGARVAVVGTRFWPYGVPRLPRHLVRVPIRGGFEALAEARPDYVLSHDHPLFFSTVHPELWREAAPSLRLLADFDPFTRAADAAVFEPGDAYYIPIHGFRGVRRPGPRIRIHAFGDGEAASR